MLRNYILLTTAIVGFLSLSSFKRTGSGKNITITKVGSSPEFKNATLKLDNVTTESAGNGSSKVNFKFKVENYQLTAQTADMATKGCNNSDKGQHIHFILDNSPYKALYEPQNEVVLNNNTEHYLLCFLSRSYHEALKNKEAAVLVHFKIDENGKYQVLSATKSPMVFYSRPKGEYYGKDVDQLLLDFYLYNCKLSNKGYKLAAHITNPDNGVDTTAILTSWDSYFIKGLGYGKCKIELSLLDKKGKPVGGTNTVVTREFKTAEAGAAK